MNEEFSELIFASLMEEVITGRVPPDLSARIQDAWQREKSVTRKLAQPTVVAEVVAEVVSRNGNKKAVPATDPKKSLAAVSPKPKLEVRSVQPVTQISANSQRSRSHAISPRRTLVAVLLAIAASGLLVVVGWRILPKVDRPLLVEKKAVTPVPTESGNRPASTTEKTRLADSTNKSTESKNGLPSREVIDIEDLPFASSHAAIPQLDLPDRSVDAVVVLPLEASEIVRSLDLRLSQLWKQVGVEPSAALPDAELAQVLNKFVADRDASDELLARLASGEEKLSRLQVASAATESASFARNWSEKLSRQWLKSSSLPLDGPPIQSLKAALAQRIGKDLPWNEVIVDVLSGALPSGEVELDSKAAPNAVFVSALAGGGNHRLLKRIGSNFLNTNLACARCHDSTPGDLQPQPGTQQVYWSMIALLKGINAKGNGLRGTRQISDTQLKLFVDGKSPSVFFDQLDGVLRQAGATLPDGRAWNYADDTSPREAFAAWIADSNLVDRAVVNQTWKLVFGRHLVPQIEGIDVVAIESRNAMLDFLAQQFEAHDRNLKKLVTWIVSSDAFARQPAVLSRAQWLSASDEQLEKLQLAELVFAVRPSLGTSSESKTLEASIAAAIRWTDSKADFDNPQVMLGQPKPKPTRNNRPSATKRNPGLEMPAPSFAIHGQRPTTAEQAYVKKLLNSSRLSWEQRVDHVVALSDYDVAYERIQQLAKELLQNNHGDPNAALLDLLWSVNNSNGI